jgi:hypothetical protein
MNGKLCYDQLMHRLKVAVIGFITAFTLLNPPRASAVIYIREGTPGEAVILSESDSYEEDITNITMEFEQSGGDLNISELEKYIQPDMNALRSLTPKKITDNIIDAEADSYTSSGVVYPCVDSSVDQNEGENEEVRSGWYHTEKLPEWYKNARQTAKFFNFAVLQKGTRLTKNLQDFREEETVMPADAYPPCDISASGTNMESTNVTISEQQLLAVVLYFIRSLVGNIFEAGENATVTIANWKINSYNEAISKTMTGRAGGSTDYLTGDDANETGKAKGYVTALKPHQIVLAGSHGSQENFEVSDAALVTNDTNFELMRKNKEFHMCSYIPYKAQDTHIPRPEIADAGSNVLGTDTEVCKFSDNSGGCGTGELPELTNIKDDCSLSNTDALANNFSANFPDGVPQLFLDAINSAAGTYNVPASLMIGTLYFEGLFNAPFVYTEDNVSTWLQCKELMPACTYTVLGDHPEDPNYGTAQFPFGHIPKWFFIGGETNGSWAAVQKVDPSRTKDIVSPCNMLDGLFGAASKLYYGSAEVPPAAQGLGNCGGYPLTNTARPTSCSQWTDAMAVQAMTAYAGYCTEPGQNDGYTAIPGRISTALDLYHQYR